MKKFKYSTRPPRSRRSSPLSLELPQKTSKMAFKTTHTFSTTATSSTTSSMEDKWVINLSKKELTPYQSLYYRKAQKLQLTQQPSLSKNISLQLLWQFSRQVNLMVLTVDACILMSVVFLIPTQINQCNRHHQIQTFSTWQSKERQGLHHCHCWQVVALVVMDKTEYITKCEALL